jgi:hypothetical protein
MFDVSGGLSGDRLQQVSDVIAEHDTLAHRSDEPAGRAGKYRHVVRSLEPVAFSELVDVVTGSSAEQLGQREVFASEQVNA